MSGADTRAQRHGSLEELRRNGGNIVGGVILLAKPPCVRTTPNARILRQPRAPRILHRPLTYRLAPATIHRV